jgi:hypothetical protein
MGRHSLLWHVANRKTSTKLAKCYDSGPFLSFLGFVIVSCLFFIFIFVFVFFQEAASFIVLVCHILNGSSL